MGRVQATMGLVFGLLLAGCQGGAAPGGAPGAPSQGAVPSVMAPDFSLPDLAGRQVKLSDSTGHVRLVDFWTTWCTPCREEIPMFKEFHASLASQGFTLIGIAMDEEGAGVVKPFAEKYGIDYLTLLGNEQTEAAFGDVVGYPTKFLIDREGRIVQRWTGAVPRAFLEKEIKRLLR